MLVVAALGGNALLRRGEPPTAENQRSNVRRAAMALAGIVKAGHRIVVTHGNGPQVGLLALQAAAYRPEAAYPLDILGAETEGMIGYLIEQELENALGRDRQVATLLTQIEVDPRDPAFRAPSKPIGPVYSQQEAEALAAARGWAIAADGDSFRRVVPSPLPKAILDIGVIRILLDNDVIVICAGGGGIPVVRRPDGSLVGIEAVIDKDRASELLARSLGADALLMLTDVDAVYERWETADAKPLGRIRAADLRKHDFPAGSMGPKVDAACNFAEASEGIAGIGTLDDALAILDGLAGTLVER